MDLAWILVANNTRARLFKSETPSSPLDELDDLAHTESRLHDREMTSDLPGKIKVAGDFGGGHAFEQPTDPKKHEADNFARYIAKYLENAHNQHKFGRLLIVAEPSFLGMLRNHLPAPVKNQVVFELDKNLATESAEEIRNHLPEYLPPL